MTGKVAALNKFFSRTTDKCMPFFKVLKKHFSELTNARKPLPS